MLKKLSVNDFDKVYDIMKKSFPSDEFRLYDEQKSLMENENYRIMVFEEGNSITAFAALWEFNDILFLEHFAVVPEKRNSGMGSMILKEISSETKKTFCLEVEPPHDDISRRRIEFYKRNDFFLNEYSYVQPSISKGKNPVKLMIMTHSNPADKQRFNSIKNTLYSYVYNDK